MKKAVLIFNKPEKCRECPCSDLPLDPDIPDTCLAENEIIHNSEEKPCWCPLKEIDDSWIIKLEHIYERIKTERENRL